MFVGTSVVIGVLSLLPSYVRRHRSCKPLALFGCGILLLISGRLWLEDSSHEIPIVVIGATLIVTSHLVNLRLCRSCAICADD
jgi:hypothetical protein